MEFKIKEYVPLIEKANMIELTVQQSVSDGVINPLLLDALFNFNMLLIYTDIKIENEEQTIAELYEYYSQNGILDTFLYEMKEKYQNELDHMKLYLNEYKNNYQEYLNSSKTIFLEIIDLMSELFKNNTDELSKIDLSKFKEILPLAESLGYNFEKVKLEEA